MYTFYHLLPFISQKLSLLALMSFSEFQKYKDDILKFIDDIDGLEKEIAERFKVL